MSVTYPKGGLQDRVTFQQNGKPGVYPVQSWNDEIGTFQFASALELGYTLPAGAAVVVPVGGDGVRLPEAGDAIAAGQPAGAKAAQATVTFTANPAADDTLTVGEVAYKYVATVADANDIKIGDTVAETVANTVAAIDVGDGVGSLYGAETVANPAAYAIQAENGSMTLFARVAGADGNELALETTAAAGVVLSGATFAGGADAGEATAANAKFAGVVAFSYWESVQNDGYAKADLDVNVPVKQKGYINVLMSSLEGAAFKVPVALDFGRPGYFKVAGAGDIEVGTINKVYADYGTCEIALKEFI